MHVASLELCKELHELSNWNTDTSFGFYYTEDQYEDGSTLWNLYNWSDTKHNPNGNYIPAYDLGYLWRKFEDLGNEQSIGYDDSGCFHHFHYGGRGAGRMIIASIGTSFSGEPQDSIEDAFCEFFIELFKQDLLHREGTGL